MDAWIPFCWWQNSTVCDFLVASHPQTTDPYVLVAPVGEGWEILSGKVFFLRESSMLPTSEFFGHVVVLKVTFWFKGQLQNSTKDWNSEEDKQQIFTKKKYFI